MANGRNLQLQRNINLINPIGNTGRRPADLRRMQPVRHALKCSAATRADTRFNNVTQVESGANSSFNALVVNYTHSISRGIQLNANYTWSHTLSNAPEVNTFEVSPSTSSIQDTTNLRRDYGNASVNRPSAFNLTAVIEPTFTLHNRFANELANHNMLALLANISSGDQSSIFTGSAQNGDGTVASITRPAFVARNTVRSPNVSQIDARYTRSISPLFDRISPSFFIEAQNLFNHQQHYRYRYCPAGRCERHSQWNAQDLQKLGARSSHRAVRRRNPLLTFKGSAWTGNGSRLPLFSKLVRSTIKKGQNAAVQPKSRQAHIGLPRANLSRYRSGPGLRRCETLLSRSPDRN